MKSKLDSLFATLRARGFEPGSVAAGWDVEANYNIILRARLNGDNLALAAVACEVLALNSPDTVRGCMYAIVSAGWLPDTGAKSYAKIQRLLTTLREKGVVPYKWIVDNIRQTVKPSSWSGLASFTETVQRAYRLDFWKSLPDYVCVVVEKDTVAGRIEEVTREFDVALHPLRGFASTSYTHEIGSQWAKIEKPITCYYVGDCDPSGLDIERDFIAKMKKYREDFTWQRLAVLPEHFEEFHIIPLAIKGKDKRAGKFIAEHGERCAEVEAIPANDLRAMVREAIESHIPPREWARLQKVEKKERESFNGFLAGLEGAA